MSLVFDYVPVHWGFRVSFEALQWVLYFLVGWATVYWRRWRQRTRESNAQGWPSVEGLVVFSKSVEIPKTSRFTVQLTYTYFVGEYRSSIHHAEFSNEDAADEFARQMKDKRIQVRYKESNPDKSVIESRSIDQIAMLSPLR